jgi:hypothetical protein
MDVRPVDPRDTRWEVDSPVYRVYFWTRPPAPPGIPPDRVMYQSNEFELTDAEDVSEVLSWAEANGEAGATFTVYAVVQAAGEKGLVRVAGRDPTSAA